MPRVSSKRQITLPMSQCEELGIHPGDEVVSFIANRQITIIKKTKGAAKAILKDTKPVNSMTDEESLASAIK